MNVLLIDDDKIDNFINKKTLETTGRVGTIDTALNGHEALDLFNNRYLPNGERPFPDLILVDLNMPVMNGFDFLKAFRELPPDKIEATKVVVVTSSRYENDITMARQLGAFHYMNKPLDGPALLKALDGPG